MAACLRAAEPPVIALALSPDGGHVIAGSQAGLRVMTWPKLETSGTLETKLEHVHDLAFSPDGKHLLAAGGSPGDVGIVELFTWPAGELVYRKTLHVDVIYAASWRADGKRFATASADRECRVVNAKDGKTLAKFKGHSRPVTAIAFLPDGETVVSTGVDETLRVWRAADGQAIRTRHNHTAPVKAMALRPSAEADPADDSGAKATGGPATGGAMVATASLDRTVRLWQPTFGRMVRFARLPTEPLSLTWSADGAQLIAGGRDGNVYVIDPDTVQFKAIATGLHGWVYTLAVGDDGDLVTGGPDGALKRVVAGDDAGAIDRDR